MIKVIRLDRINELLEDYESMKKEDESFRKFIEVSGMLDEGKPKLFDWEFVELKHLMEVYEE